MKTWEWVAIGLVVLVGGWWLYNNYLTSVPGSSVNPTGNSVPTSPPGTPSTSFNPTVNPSPTNTLNSDGTSPSITPYGQTGPTDVTATAQSTQDAQRQQDFITAVHQVVQYQTLNPTSLVPGTGPGGAYIVSPEVIATAHTTGATSALAHPLLSGRRH